MIFAQTTTATAPLIPPRPNLGPEPWPEPWPDRWTVAGLGLALAIITTVTWRLRRRGTQRAVGTLSVAATTDGDLPSSRPHVIDCAERVRNALVARFGPTWAARTTEEIASDSDLAQALGPERSGRLIALLQAADRAKFAETVTDEAQRDAWDACAEDLAAGIAAAGATSRINGR